MSQKLIIANWKMNPQTQKDSDKIAGAISNAIKNFKNSSIVICPPIPFISNLKLKNKKIAIGAQNISSESDGAYTGEVSAKMVSSIGASYVIIGHSERRAMGEDNSIVNKKILLALKNKLTPVLCVGEKERDHNGFYLSFVKNQIHECLASVSKSQIKNIVIAYEPIWAIGADASRTAEVSEFIEMSIFIKKVISDLYDIKIAHSMRVLYGGSVHPENALSFLVEGNADGLLVGRDSLNPKKIVKIISIADQIK
jgi:triosephosphate isomerase